MLTIGRPRVAFAYVWLTFLIAGLVFLQGFLFGAFYSEGNRDYMDIHRLVGEYSGNVTILLVVLAFLARFPGELRIGWWALAWSVLWNVQVWIVGDGIKEDRWLEMIHIPLGMFLVVSGMFLAYRCLNVLRSASTKTSLSGGSSK